MAISRRVKVSTMKIARVIAIVARGCTIGEAKHACIGEPHPLSPPPALHPGIMTVLNF